jgi:hypothetical protein
MREGNGARRVPVPLAAAAVVAVLARLAYVAVFASGRLSDDEISFWGIAENLAHGHGFSYLGGATAWRPPLYPILLALLRVGGIGVRPVLVVQAVGGAATPLLLWACARRLGVGRGGATVAAALGAVYPPFVYLAGRILSENLSVPMLLLAVWATLGLLGEPALGSCPLVGAAWGLAVLARPAALSGLVVAVAVLALLVGTRAAPAGAERIRGGPRGKGRGAWAAAALVAVSAGVVVAPWTVRNALQVGGPLPVVSNEGVTLWAPNRLDTNQLKNVFRDANYGGLQDYVVYGRAFGGIERLARQRHFDFDHASEAQRDSWFRSLALHDIAHDPARFAARTAEKALLMLVPAPDNASQTQKTSLAATVVLWVISGPVIAAGVIGLAVLAVRRTPAGVFLGANALIALLVLAAHLPYVRYRAGEVDPLLILGAAWLAAAALARWPVSRRRPPERAGVSAGAPAGAPADAAEGTAPSGPAAPAG